MSDIPLNLKKVKFLLPSDIFYVLFPESIPLEENQNQSDNGIIVNGFGDGTTVQAANSMVGPSTRIVPDYEVGEHCDFFAGVDPPRQSDITHLMRLRRRVGNLQAKLTAAKRINKKLMVLGIVMWIFTLLATYIWMKNSCKCKKSLAYL